jgi:hypothetical protein
MSQLLWVLDGQISALKGHPMHRNPLRKSIQLNRWFSGWLYCFQHNTDYKAYCDAKQRMDNELCSALEKQHDLIAGLYRDWGNIHAIDARSSTESFQSWYKSKVNLFHESSIVGWVAEPGNYTHRSGHLLLDVPFANLKSVTMENLKQFIDQAYKLRQLAAEQSSNEVERLVNQPLPGPKYTLKGDLMNSSIGRLLKAIYVNDIIATEKTGKHFTNAEIVLRAMCDPENPFKWKMLKHDHEAVAAGTFYNSITGSSEISLIKRHRKDFDALVRNTVQGNFPDYT